MAQFDVYANPMAATRAVFPYLVDLQSNQLRQLTTRLTMPLQRLPRAPKGLPRRLTQTVVIDGEPFFLAAQQCAALPASQLRKPVANLAEERATVLDALDAVISGV